jgi:hypothetical protein
VRLSSVNLSLPHSSALPPLANPNSSHCIPCAGHPARNDFPFTCGGLSLARVVDYPSALHLLSASTSRLLRGHFLLRPFILFFAA